MGPRFRAAFNDVLGGGVTSVLNVTFGLSYALLIFGGPLSPHLGYGVAATFVSSAIIGAVLALASSLPCAIGAPDSSTAAMTAILSASLVERIGGSQAATPLIGPVLLTLAGASIITGIVLCGFGMTRLGRAIRYVPYPVVGGFLGATACLILAGAVRVITGQRLQLEALTQFAAPQTMFELAAASAMALVLFIAWRRSRNALALPAILIGGVLTAHALFWLSGISLAQAQASGWTFQPPPPANLWVPWNLDQIEHYPWHVLPELSGDLIAVVFVTISCALFNTAGIEVALHSEANLERELNATGLANILSGACGGYSGCISVSRTVLNAGSGGNGRLSGLTVAAISALMLLAAPVLLGYMPKFVLGGLLIYLGADQLHRWLIASRRRLSFAEYLSLLAIIVIIVKWGFVAGILIGVVIGCATFALSASRIDSIKYGFDGSEYRSSLDRSRDDQALLAEHGGKIQGLTLQSYLFFGSANRLYLRTKELLQRQPDCQFLVFDFKHVTGIDSSAAYSFSQIKSCALERAVKIVLVHLPAAAEKALRSTDFISGDVSVAPELDIALEWCEDQVIAQHQDRDQDDANLRDWFMQLLDDEHAVAELIRRCQRVEVSAGDIIVRSGDPADSMHFILDGRVGVMIPIADGRVTRVRSLGRCTTIGEMGLVSHAPRNATIQAEIDSVLYVLSASAFEDIKTTDPVLGQRLLTYFVSVMAERLTFANQTIGVLRR